ncbi:MAG TPA: type IV pilus assembly protein PilM [Bacteriovoracaceae bacterium]|nr:type IV pilus assembly protein PilM [Bacteriovoracaceae bacterium]
MAASLKQQLEDLIANLNPGSIVGLDIGAHSIKVCEVSGSYGKIKVEKFGIFVLSEAALIEDEIQKPAELLAGVEEALGRANIKSRTLCLGLFGPNTMTKRLNVPEGSKEEIEDHVMWEAEQYITFGADESQIDFHLLGDNEGGGKDALVAAAKNDLVNTYSNLLKSAKLNVRVADLNVIALSNVFEEVAAERLEEYSTGTLLLDFGAQSTKVVVYKRGGPIFTKEIPVGGSLITEEIQRQMGVSYEEAEDLKSAVDSNGNLPQEILNIINIQVDSQVAEIRKNINFYVTQGSAEKVNYCFVTGGSSLLPGLLDKLTEVTGVPSERLDIFANIVIDEKKIGHNIAQLAAIAPVVIGLAMRKI